MGDRSWDDSEHHGLQEGETPWVYKPLANLGAESFTKAPLESDPESENEDPNMDEEETDRVKDMDSHRADVST